MLTFPPGEIERENTVDGVRQRQRDGGEREKEMALVDRKRERIEEK